MALRIRLLLSGFLASVMTLTCAFRVMPPLVEIPEQQQAVFSPDIHIDRRSPMQGPAYPLASVVATGDLMMGSWVVSLLRSNGYNYPFDSTRAKLAAGDFTIVNLEAPFTATGERFDKKYTFKVPMAFSAGVKSAGIDIVTLANNHSLDYGCEGLSNTLAALDSAHIAHCGAGVNRTQACGPTIMSKYGLKIAFLGFSMTFPQEFWASDTSCGTCYPHERQLVSSINKCEDLADLTVVSFHWGAERRTEPKEYQKIFAHLAIDCGADLVLGHHPHVLQGLEIYKNRLIAYSLGNYVFGSYVDYVRHSAILKVYLSPEQLIYAEVVPISVYNVQVEFQPRILRGKDRSAVIYELAELSRPLNAGVDIIDTNGCIVPPGTTGIGSVAETGTQKISISN